MELDPALLVGPWGLTFFLLYVVWKQDKTIHDKDEAIEELRNESVALLKKYQDRDEEDRLWRQSLERKRSEGGR